MAVSKYSIKYHNSVVRCRICKRVIPQKEGRGRIKEIHEQCGQYESALNRITRFLSAEVTWENEAALKGQKGDILTVLNQHADKRTSRFVEHEEEAT